MFAALNPQAFEQCFHRLITSITETIGAQVIPIDGKTVRQSFDRNAGQKAIHVVSAQVLRTQVSIGSTSSRF